MRSLGEGSQLNWVVWPLSRACTGELGTLVTVQSSCHSAHQLSFANLLLLSNIKVAAQPHSSHSKTFPPSFIPFLQQSGRRRAQCVTSCGGERLF